MTDVSSSSPARRPIFAIFEGGGARGIAHVGAMDAIAANNLEIIGVAGTSAGALAAVLAAIGLEAADIMDDQDPAANILTRHGRNPIQLLGENAWQEFSLLRDAGAELVKHGWPLRIAYGLFESFQAAPILFNAFRRRGHFTTEVIKDFVSEVVRTRLATIKAEANLSLAVPDDPTFGDLSSDWPTVIPLKIVVTDVTHGTLVVFDRHMTPNVKVAEAVAASIAIPYVFEPARIPSFRPGLFADGGLVANLPISYAALGGVFSAAGQCTEHCIPQPPGQMRFALMQSDEIALDPARDRKSKFDKGSVRKAGQAGREKMLEPQAQGHLTVIYEGFPELRRIEPSPRLETECGKGARRPGPDQAFKGVRPLEHCRALIAEGDGALSDSTQGLVDNCARIGVDADKAGAAFVTIVSVCIPGRAPAGICYSEFRKVGACFV